MTTVADDDGDPLGSQRRAAHAVSLRANAWQAVLAVGLALVCVFVLVAPARPLVLWLSAVAAPIVVAWGIRLHRPRRPGAWWIFTAGLVIIAGGATLIAAIGERLVAAPADLAQNIILAGVIVQQVGLVRLTRPRSGFDPWSLLDVGVFVVAFLVVSWFLVFDAAVARSSLPMGDVAPLIVYLAVDVGFVLFTIHLLLAPGRRQASFWFILGAVAAVLVSQVALSLDIVQRPAGPSDPATLGFMVAGICWSLAATHPSIVHLTESDPSVGIRPVSRARLAALALATLTAPVLLLLVAPDDRYDLPVVALATIGMSVLVIARLAHAMFGLDGALAARERLAAIVEQSSDGIVVTDADTRIVYANAAFLADMATTLPELVGKIGLEINHGTLDLDALAEADRLARTGKPWLGEVARTRADGSTRRVELRVTPRFAGDGAIEGHVAVVRDVTALRQAEAEIELEGRIRAALTESLHGIPEEASVAEAAQAICNELVTLPFIDMAGVTAAVGDNDLQVIAIRAPAGFPVAVGDHLPAHRAALDTERTAIGPWAEYTTSDPADGGWTARIAATGLRARAFGPIVHGNHVEGALVIGTLDAQFARTLVEKMPGIVSLSATSSALLAERLHALRRTAELRDGVAAILAGRSFHPVFQPIVELESGNVVGYEALTRFDSGQRPDLCFADAWSVGLGPELELATLAAAVEVGTRLAPGVWLSLNVSPSLLADPERLRAILWEAGRPVVVEVTEHEVIEDYDVVRDAVRQLGNDIRLAVDDAGAGVANFGHIIDLRPDFVKLDISLVRRVNANLGRQAMVVGMRHFSRTAGCRLIAEGVETAEEARTLTALGVEFGQGYWLGRPEPVEAWLKDGAGSVRLTTQPPVAPARDTRPGRAADRPSRVLTPSLPADRQVGGSGVAGSHARRAP